VIGRAEIMDAPCPGGLGGTYAGNPLACAAALAVLDTFEQEHLLEKAEKQGKIIMERMTAIKAKGKGMPIGDIRGLGAMCAFELRHPARRQRARCRRRQGAGGEWHGARPLDPHLRRLRRHGAHADPAHRLRDGC